MLGTVIPYHDENETTRPAYVTMAIIAINVLVWVFIQGAGTSQMLAASVCNLGLIPAELTQSVRPGTGFPMGDGMACLVDPGREPLHVLTSMFLHGSWMHLIGNMWFLWLFGNNIEDSMTRPRFVVFYGICGVAAALLQTVINPRSIVPMVGASGAISGVMGAYLILYPRVRVFTLVPLGFFMTSMALPAWAMLLYWAFIQFVGGLVAVGGEGQGGVAFWAHVGGFLAGVLLVRVFRRADFVNAHRDGAWRPRRVGWE
jgi:membrane associated rhomboid family serine protease